MFKRILVAVDGSPTSNAGLQSAVALAVDQRATLVPLHVVDETSLAVGLEGGFTIPDYIDTFYASLREHGRRILAKAEAAAKKAGVACKVMLVESRAETVAHAILQQARKQKADVIVIGTHGRRGLERVLMGSDAELIVREAGVPVLLVRRRARKLPPRAIATQRATMPRRSMKSPRAAAGD